MDTIISAGEGRGLLDALRSDEGEEATAFPCAGKDTIVAGKDTIVAGKDTIGADRERTRGVAPPRSSLRTVTAA